MIFLRGKLRSVDHDSNFTFLLKFIALLRKEDMQLQIKETFNKGNTIKSLERKVFVLKKLFFEAYRD